MLHVLMSPDNISDRTTMYETLYQFDSVSWCRAKDPNAVFLGRVGVWKVRAGEVAVDCGYFVLAAALFAIVSVVVQNKS